ncbi:hypothetical protein [Azospirillum sp. ST 5-10]|uniref:hypothetical protein n=1 Tax=unclassified Azospirillum TaxID=2630922 RepID=UPI003F4A827B
MSEAVAKLPARTPAGALAKLAMFADQLEDLQLGRCDSEHPAVYLKRTLLAAAERFGGPLGEAIHFGIEEAERRGQKSADDGRNILKLSEQLRSSIGLEERTNASRSGRTVKGVLLEHRILEALLKLQPDEREQWVQQLERFVADVEAAEAQFTETYRQLRRDARRRLWAQATELRDQPSSDFADAVNAFGEAGAEAVALPVQPSVAMVAAGARIGGISEEQARAIYAAMAEAFQQERAA